LRFNIRDAQGVSIKADDVGVSPHKQSLGTMEAHLTRIEALLKQGVRQADLEPFYSCTNDKGEPTPWDEIVATGGPIRAAISADDEQSEALKSRRVIDFLATECPGGSIVDLGCGYGRVAKYLLAERTFDMYVGVDSSVAMLRLFAERYRSRAVEQRTPLALVRSNIEDLLLNDCSVDAVLSCAVLLHNPKRVSQTTLTEVLRVLKPGGKLFLLDSLPNRYSPVGLLGTLYQGAYFLRGEHGRNGPLRYFSTSDVRNLCAGFDAVQIRRVGFAPLPKSFPFLSERWNKLYRDKIFDPTYRAGSRFAPSAVKELSCAFLDVIATKAPG
jgi:ubiquinone/menaquinone biosynthesis C-methylase UbiE